MNLANHIPTEIAFFIIYIGNNKDAHVLQACFTVFKSSCFSATIVVHLKVCCSFISILLNDISRCI